MSAKFFEAFSLDGFDRCLHSWILKLAKLQLGGLITDGLYMHWRCHQGWNHHCENAAVFRYLTVDKVNLTRKIVKKVFSWKIRENVAVFRYLTVDKFNLTRKFVEKVFSWKIREKAAVFRFLTVDKLTSSIWRDL